MPIIYMVDSHETPLELLVLIRINTAFIHFKLPGTISFMHFFCYFQMSGGKAANETPTTGVIDNDNSVISRGLPWPGYDTSLLTVLVVNTLLTLIWGCLLTACIMWTLSRRSRHKEERDKLGSIIQTQYWEHEEAITDTIRILTKMKQNTLFRDVSELHVFAYKYRAENGTLAFRVIYECFIFCLFHQMALCK